MANKNTKINNLKYWSYGATIPIIDNGVAWPAGVPVPVAGVEASCYVTNNWFGSQYYWYEGTCSGVLQGDPEILPPNPNITSRNLYYVKRFAECGVSTETSSLTRSFAVII